MSGGWQRTPHGCISVLKSADHPGYCAACYAFSVPQPALSACSDRPRACRAAVALWRLGVMFAPEFRWLRAVVSPKFRNPMPQQTHNRPYRAIAPTLPQCALTLQFARNMIRCGLTRQCWGKRHPPAHFPNGMKPVIVLLIIHFNRKIGSLSSRSISPFWPPHRPPPGPRRARNMVNPTAIRP